MRAMAMLVLGTAWLVAGCGGSTAIDFPGADGGSDGSTGGDAGDAGDAGCTGTFSCLCGTPICVAGQWQCPSGCGDPCAILLGQLETARKKLRACCPTCKSIQCQGTARDVCCAITVQASSDVASFEALVRQYENTCHPSCPATPCPVVPSGICDPQQGGDPNSGQCR